MTRISETLLSNSTAFARGHSAPMANPTYSGQNGFAPALNELAGNTPYTRSNIFCLLVEAPLGFSNLPESSTWISTLKSLVELHAQSIEGLNATLEVEFGNSPVGGSGQVHEVPTDVKETPSKPVFKWSEKYGSPISTFFRGWITYLLMDPHSKVPNVATLNNKPTDMLTDQRAATMIFIEPDPTHTKVVRAWLVANMMPQTSGEITGRRDLTQPVETPTVDITFTGIAQYGEGVNAFAQTLMDTISLTGANPQLRPAFVTAISSDVNAAAKGFANQVTTMASSAVTV